MASRFVRTTALAVLAWSLVVNVAPRGVGAAPLDQDVFDTCRDVRDASGGSPGRSEVRSLARRFARLPDRTARRALASALENAETAKERRRAVASAYRWCERQAGAYQQVVLGLAVPTVMQIVDESTVTITGTVTPGASVSARVSSLGTARVVPATVDAAGTFSIVLTDLPLGETTATIEAVASLRYEATPQTVRITRIESEAAYKASAREIPSDELKKDPIGLRGTRIYSRGEVFQYDSRTGLTAMLVYVRVVNPGRFELWTDPVLLRLENAAQGSGIDEDDIIDFWGDVQGAYSYQTAIGGSNTVPEIKARYVTLVEKR